MYLLAPLVIAVILHALTAYAAVKATRHRARLIGATLVQLAGETTLLAWALVVNGPLTEKFFWINADVWEKMWYAVPALSLGMDLAGMGLLLQACWRLRDAQAVRWPLGGAIFASVLMILIAPLAYLGYLFTANSY